MQLNPRSIRRAGGVVDKHFMKDLQLTTVLAVTIEQEIKQDEIKQDEIKQVSETNEEGQPLTTVNSPAAPVWLLPCSPEGCCYRPASLGPVAYNSNCCKLPVPAKQGGSKGRWDR